MQNSLDRLLTGIVDALREVVAPATDDPYARAQAEAAADLLANLQPRVTWRIDAELPWLAPTRRAAALALRRNATAELPAASRAMKLPPPGDLPTDAPTVECFLRVHLDALAELVARTAADPRPDPEIVGELRAALDAQAEVERDLLRRPGRAATETKKPEKGTQ